jgi:hypothetical protein
MTCVLAILAATPIIAFALVIALCALVVVREGASGVSEVAKVLTAFRLDLVLKALGSSAQALTRSAENAPEGGDTPPPGSG